MIKGIEIGDIVKGKRLNRRVTGKVIIIYPGSVVILSRNKLGDEERVVVDADRIFKVIKKQKK